MNYYYELGLRNLHCWLPQRHYFLPQNLLPHCDLRQQKTRSSAIARKSWPYYLCPRQDNAWRPLPPAWYL